MDEIKYENARDLMHKIKQARKSLTNVGKYPDMFYIKDYPISTDEFNLLRDLYKSILEKNIAKFQKKFDEL